MRRCTALLGAVFLSGCFLFEKPTPPPEDTGEPIPEENCPLLVLEQTEVVWDDVYHGTSVEQDVVVSNDCVGNVPLSVTLSLSNSALFSLTVDALNLQPGESASVPVIFSPEEPGQTTVVLTVRGSDSSVSEVSLVGNASLNPDWDGDGFDSVDVGGTDCDDADSRVYPGAPDACYDGLDRNCDNANENDCDGDGFEAEHMGGNDCADEDPDIFPGAAESRNGDDDDCDGTSDEGMISAGDVVFSEFMSNPKNTPDSRGEWFEVRNTTDVPIDIRGWVVGRDTESFTVSSSVRIPPLGQRVLANSDNPGRNGGFVADYEFSAAAFKMPNTTDEVYTLHFGTLQIAALPVHASRVSEGVSIGLDPRMTTVTKALDWTNWCVADTQLPSGDWGSPGTENRSCPGLDDVDRDGYTLAGGDCDDSDAKIHPGASEIWGDWVDNDCSGRADVSSVSSLTTTTLNGGSTNSNPHNWGHLGQLGVGDVDDDGLDEWLVGGSNLYDYVGGVLWVPSESYRSFSGAADGIEEGHVEGYAEKHAFGIIGPAMADNSGDKLVDLVVAGHDYYESDDNVAVALFEGGKSLGGSLGDGDALAEWTGSESSSSATVLSHLDWDGDGVAEILYGEPRTFYGSSGDNYRGRVVWLDGEDATGSVTLDDGDGIWDGVVNSDALGASMAGADLDGDGYGDVVLSAPGRDDAADSGGAVYVVFGSTTRPADDDVEDIYDVKLTGHLKGARLGEGMEPIFADINGDTAVDLVVSAYAQESVYVFLDVASLTGTISTSSADLEIVGSGSPSAFGLGLAAGDVNGDGFDEIVVSAPDDDTSDPGAHATVAGALYIFSGATLTAGSYGDSDAAARVTGASVSDGFGQSILGVDVDSDGLMDLLINEPGAVSKKGRVRVWEIW